MAWVNVFSVGACTLQVWRDTGDGFAQMTPPEMTADGVTITESGGSVTLTTPANGLAYRGVVVPSYDPAGAPARLAGMSCDVESGTLSDLDGEILAVGSDPGVSVALSVVGVVVSPDPASLPATAGWTMAGVDIVVNGGG
ncbi:MAG TPA: hypothetical protein VFH85_07700 [Gammaproteobacteria bacterium]|nr:hypothetical protein [Gammaproteobacteria bacterium]